MQISKLRHLTVFLAFVVLALTGCEQTSSESAQVKTQADQKIALISITSDPLKNPQAVNMGLTFSGFCVDEGYKVAIFFNVKGTILPTKSFDPEFKYLEHTPMATQLGALKKRGVELHVCPVCMGDLKIEKDQIVEEAFVTSKPKLFANLGADTIVFTY
jgi:predicted peroxiredoxin